MMPDPHAIQWLNMPGYKGETLNPIRARRREGIGWHCEAIATGCQNCYAESMNGGTKLSYNRKNRDEVIHFLHRPTLEKPLHWRKPRMVFWMDMGDLYGDWVLDEWIDQCFAVMAATPQHVHCVLTKRLKRVAEYLRAHGEREVPRDTKKLAAWPLPNVWLGTSCSTQADVDRLAPILLGCPAAVRFLSLEPLLREIALRQAGCFMWHKSPCKAHARFNLECVQCRKEWEAPKVKSLIDWVIIGAESGPRRRPRETDWIRGLRDECVAASVPLFVKQSHENGRLVKMPEIDGKVWNQWPSPAEAEKGKADA